MLPVDSNTLIPYVDLRAGKAGIKCDMNTKPKLLLVDDETAINDRLAAFLYRAGYGVRAVASGQGHQIIRGGIVK